MFRKIADAVTHRPIVFLILFFVIAVIGLANVPHIKFNFTPQQLFKVSGDDLAYREAFADAFGREDNAFFILIDSDDVYTPENLRALRDVVSDLRQLKSVRAAESLATLPLPRTGDAGSLTTEPMVPTRGEITDERAAKFQAFASQEPLLTGRLVNKKGTRTLLMVWFQTEINDVGPLQTAIDEVNVVLKDVEWPPQNTFRFGGIPQLRTEIVRNLKHQQLTFIPATGLAYLFVLFFLFRRFSGVIAPILVVIIATLMITSVMVWMGSAINIINNIVPSLIFIIGISDSIHMLIRDAEEMEIRQSRKESIKRMIWYTGAACLLTSVTTAVGFFSLFMASTEILRDFGWQAGLGVMFAYAVTLFCLPAILIFLKPVHRSSAVGSRDAKLERYIAKLATLILNNTKKTLAISFAVTSIFVFFASEVVIDTTLLEVYTDDHPSYKTTDVLNREFGGILPFEISLDSTENDAFKDPKVFKKIKELQNFAAQQQYVLATDSLVDFHQAARGALLGDPSERQNMPTSRSQIEQLHLLIAGNPDDPNGLNRFISPDFRRARILLRVSDAGSRAQMELAEILKQELASQFKGTSIRYRITGDAYIASKSLSIFVHDLFGSLMLAALIIFFMMTFVFRSFKLGLISIIPNIVPLILTFGYMGMTGTTLNTTTVIIFAISLGIAVDDTIHFLARFEEGRKKTNQNGQNHTVREALMEAYDGAGRAILLTSFMLLVGLAVLASSNFLPTRQFAILTSFTIAGAILGDLFILPPMLLLAFGTDDEDD